MKTGVSRIFALLLGLALALSAFGGVGYAQSKGPTVGVENQLGPDAPNTITLPDIGNITTSGTAWTITNNGTGRVAYFNLNNPSTNNPAIEVRTVSSTTSALGVLGIAAATQGGSFSAGVRGVNGSTTSRGYGVIGTHNGSGAGMYGYANGAGGRGVYGLSVATSGAGKGVNGEARSPVSYGGYFVNTATSGPARGVYGESKSIEGYGVHGVSHFIGVYGTGVTGVSGQGGTGVRGQGSSVGVVGSGNTGVYGEGLNHGVRGISTKIGVYGEGIAGNSSGVSGIGSGSKSTGVYGEATGLEGIGVSGIGSGTNSTGVRGEGSNWGVIGEGIMGVVGNGSGWGVRAYGGTYGIFADGSTGVYGLGNGNNSTGVWGTSSGGSGIGVYGENMYNVGVEGKGKWAVIGRGSYMGVFGEASGEATFGVYGKALGVTSYAGFFEGKVKITGSCTGCAGSTAQIDHPLDSTKYVEQADVLASERLGMANGNVVVDAKGQAVISLPAWFESMYADHRYVLTPIGDFAPLYIAKRVSNNQFVIAGGKAGMEVSWQVSGVRQDKYAKENPLVVEGLKSELQKPATVPEAKELLEPREGGEQPIKP